MSKLIITRHGQSMTNIDEDIKARERGESPVLNVRNNVLTLPGIEQALEFGRKLNSSQDVKIKNIVCSPYARTKQTAYCIASCLAGLPMIHYNRQIREIDWKIAGKFHRLEDSIPGFNTKSLPVDHKPIINKRARLYSLESQREVYDRVIAAVAQLVTRYGDAGDLLLVTHYYPVKALCAWINEGRAEAMSEYDPRNLCHVEFELENVARAITRRRE